MNEISNSAIFVPFYHSDVAGNLADMDLLTPDAPFLLLSLVLC